MSDSNTSSGHLKNRMEQRMMMIPEIQNTDDKWFHMIYCQMRGGGAKQQLELLITSPQLLVKL